MFSSISFCPNFVEKWVPTTKVWNKLVTKEGAIGLPSPEYMFTLRIRVNNTLSLLIRLLLYKTTPTINKCSQTIQNTSKKIHKVMKILVCFLYVFCEKWTTTKDRILRKFPEFLWTKLDFTLFVKMKISRDSK